MPKSKPKVRFHVTILGSGTCVPSLSRSSCSVMVETNQSVIVMDTGPGTMHRLLSAGKTVFDVSHVFYSHFHPDHSGELVPLLFSAKYPDPDRRETPLVMGGGPGFQNFYQQLKGVYGEWIDLGGKLKLTEFDPRKQVSYDFPDFRVDVRRVRHREESVAYRITGPNNLTVVYSGDTDMCDELVDIAEKADLFICESALPDELKAEGHLTPSLAGEVASRAHVKALVLTHFYPECDQADIRRQCRGTFSGQLLLAEDLMKIELEGS